VPPAGDQHQALPGAGQQREHLLAADRVVEDQQQLPSGQPVPPQPHPRFQVSRDLGGRDPDGQQQAGKRVGRAQRLLPRRVPVQRQEDLPAGKPAGEPVRGVHRERGLADAGHPADRMNAHHPARPRRRVHQLGQLLPPAGERGDVAGQRSDGRRRPASPGAARPGAAPRGGLEVGPGRAVQVQCLGEQPHRVLVRGGDHAPLQVADRPRAQPGRPGQLLLRQPGPGAQPPQRTGERNRRLSHIVSPCPQTARFRLSIRRQFSSIQFCVRFFMFIARSRCLA